MQTVTTIGLDIAKSVFQVHGIDAEGKVVVRRQLKHRYALAFFQKLSHCRVGIEACASSHHWSRELQSLGHTVRGRRVGASDAPHDTEACLGTLLGSPHQA
jgi:transposase